MQFDSTELAHLEAVAHVFEWRDESTLCGFDKEHRLAAPVDGDPPQAPAIATLSTLLYEHLYCRGGLTPNLLAAVRSSGVATSSFATDILAENQLPVAWQNGWIQDNTRADQTDQVFLRRSGIGVTAERTDVRFVEGTNEALLRCPTTDMHASPGFLFFSNAAFKPMSTDNMIRFYWHLTPQIAPAFMRQVTSQFADIPFQAKLLQAPGNYQRCDAGVLYLDIATLELDKVVAVHSALVDELKPNRPAFTLPLARGLGAAAEPASHESFGQRVCRAMAEGVIGLGPGRHDPSSKVAVMRAAIAAIDPTQQTVHGLDPTLTATLVEAPWGRRVARTAARSHSPASADANRSSIAVHCSQELVSRAVDAGAVVRWVQPATGDQVVRLTDHTFVTGNGGIVAFLRKAEQMGGRQEKAHGATNGAPTALPDSSTGAGATSVALGDGLSRQLLAASLAGSDTSGLVATLARRATRTNHRSLGAGLWSGRSGIAYALATAWQATGNELAADAAKSLVSGIVREWERDGGWVSHRHDPKGRSLGRGVAPDAIGLNEGPAGIALALLETGRLLRLDPVVQDAVEDAATQARCELADLVGDLASPLGLCDGLAGVALGVQMLAQLGVDAAQGTDPLVQQAWARIHQACERGSLGDDPTWSSGLAGIGFAALVSQAEAICPPELGGVLTELTLG